MEVSSYVRHPEGALEGIGEQFHEREQQQEAYELGMWTFLASEAMLFGGLFLSYLIARAAGGEGFLEASNHTDLALGAFNTGLLLLSSWTMALAVDAGRKGDRSRILRWLGVTALLGSIFLGIKLFEWYLEYHEGLVPGWHWTDQGKHDRAFQLFFWQYFTMTGLHALHLLGAVTAVLGVGVLAFRSRGTFEHPSILEITGLYWHLVDVIWIFLFPLLYLLGRHLHA